MIIAAKVVGVGHTLQEELFSAYTSDQSFDQSVCLPALTSKQGDVIVLVSSMYV